MAPKQETKDPGSGSIYEKKPPRIINKDGSFNVLRKNKKQGRRTIFHHLINISWGKFFGYVLGWYVGLNILFALVYMTLGPDAIRVPVEDLGMPLFWRSFFFSIETFTTVGYGHMYPVGYLAHFISTIEALVGLLSIAVFTGLLYGRFSKPSARLIFSKKALIAPYKDGKSLQFRLVNKHSNVLVEVEATVLLVLTERDDRGTRLHYFNLELETNSILFFPLSWTVVHHITEDSPFHGFSYKEMMEQNAEILISVKGYDDGFSQYVFQRHSYTCNEVKWGARFVRPFQSKETGEVVLDVSKVSEWEELEMKKDLNL